MPEKKLPDLPEVTLDTLCQGAVPELFAAEFKRVLENILDVNSHPTKKREIVITVQIEPDKNSRKEGKISVSAKSKLAGALGASSNIFMGRRMGEVVATTYDPRQQQIKWDQEAKPKALRSPEDRKAAASS